MINFPENPPPILVTFTKPTFAFHRTAADAASQGCGTHAVCGLYAVIHLHEPTDTFDWLR